MFVWPWVGFIAYYIDLAITKNTFIFLRNCSFSSNLHEYNHNDSIFDNEFIVHNFSYFCLFLPVLPLYVHITSEQSPLSAERVYDLHCVTFGSRPPALVTWWIGNTQLLDHSSQVYSIHFSFSLIFTDPQKSISRRINRAWGYLFVLCNLETL